MARGILILFIIWRVVPFLIPRFRRGSGLVLPDDTPFIVNSSPQWDILHHEEAEQTHPTKRCHGHPNQPQTVEECLLYFRLRWLVITRDIWDK